MLGKTAEQCLHILEGKARGKCQIDPFLPIYRGRFSDSEEGFAEGSQKGS